MNEYDQEEDSDDLSHMMGMSGNNKGLDADRMEKALQEMDREPDHISNNAFNPLRVRR